MLYLEPRYVFLILTKTKIQNLTTSPSGKQTLNQKVRADFWKSLPSACSAHNMFLKAPFCPSGIGAFLSLRCRVNTFPLNRFILFLLSAWGCLWLFKILWDLDITPATWGKAHSRCELWSSVIPRRRSSGSSGACHTLALLNACSTPTGIPRRRTLLWAGEKTTAL